MLNGDLVKRGVETVSTGMAPEVATNEGDPEALFATDITNNVMILKNVILNEFHVLRKFSFIR